ncbi:MAG: hypothetical protein OK456_05025 [Thaumarchaeota archaeon]|nr:hypothetical protein [Nitrososphaerota archaeon]
MTSNTKPLVLALLLVQALVSASLWLLNAISVESTTTLYLLLAADVVIFAGICHVSFFSDEEAAEKAMPLPPSLAFQTDDSGRLASRHDHHPPRPLFHLPTVLSRNIRLAVPLSSIGMLSLLAVVVASGRGSTDLFIPVFIFMVVVYVLSSIYVFKVIIERDTQTAQMEDERVERALEDAGHH